MQPRLLLLGMAVIGVALAGCAENTTTPGDDAGTPPTNVPSTMDAAALFAAAAEGVPDKYGMKLAATKDGAPLMTADSVYDEPAKTAFFRIRMDPEFLARSGQGAQAPGMDPSMLENLAVYTSPQGNAFLANDTVMLSEPSEDAFGGAAEDNDGLEALTDPEELLSGFGEDNFTVTSVTPTTLRGRGALKLDATVTDEGRAQNVTVWLFQNPTRVARVEALIPGAPDAEDDDADEFAGAMMEMDFLYDTEVTLAVPEELTRALGLRHESNREPFSFGGNTGPEVWTFQVDSNIALGDVQAEVGTFGETEPTWSMSLSEGTKTAEGVTLTFADVDANGKISKNDTLTIQTEEDGMPAQVTLKDLVTGYRVVPGTGVLFAGLAIAGAALVLRRR